LKFEKEKLIKQTPIVFPENDYKEIIIQKDNIIANLKSTIEVNIYLYIKNR